MKNLLDANEYPSQIDYDWNKHETCLTKISDLVEIGFVKSIELENC